MNLRLVSKSLAAIAAEHLPFSEINCFPYRKCLAYLGFLSQSSVRHLVKSIQYSSLYISTCDAGIWVTAKMIGEGTPECEEVYDICRGFERAEIREDSFMNSEFSPSALVTSLLNFPNLQEYRVSTVTSDFSFNPWRPQSYVAEDDIGAVLGGAEYDLYTERAIALAVCKALFAPELLGKSSLKSLVLTHISWKSLDSDLNYARMLDSPQSFNSMKRLYIELTDVPYNGEDYTHQNPIRNCVAFFRKPMLARILGACTGLSELQVHFKFLKADDHVAPLPVDLAKVLGDNHWPQLRICRVSCVETTSSTLLKFLDRHKESLREFQTSGTTLLNNESWLTVLLQVRRLLAERMRRDLECEWTGYLAATFRPTSTLPDDLWPDDDWNIDTELSVISTYHTAIVGEPYYLEDYSQIWNISPEVFLDGSTIALDAALVGWMHSNAVFPPDCPLNRDNAVWWKEEHASTQT